MKNIAIIGFGNHVKKNILPCFSKLNVKIKSVVVTNLNKYSHQEIQEFILTDDIDVVLSDGSLDFVYIATPISTHYELSLKCLKNKISVICEKPITTNKRDLGILIETAKENFCRIEQVEMYKYHNQFKAVKDIIDSKKFGTVKSANFNFKIPHLDVSDIRYDRAKAGGALFDVGFYPLSALLALFPSSKMIFSHISSEKWCDVDLNGIAIFEDDHNSVFTCNWSIGSCYQNKIQIEFPKHRLEIDRAFSKSESYESNLVIVDQYGVEEVVDTGKHNHFVNMFESLFSNRQTLTDFNVISLIESIHTNYLNSIND